MRETDLASFTRPKNCKRLIIVTLISLFLFSLAGYVNQIPWYDDKAYLNNALIYSGRISPSEAIGPHAKERPPLFWWTLASFMIFNVPIEFAKYVSPIFGILLIIIIYLFGSRLFKDPSAGYLSGLFLSFNAFFILITGMVLSDVPGTTQSTLFLFTLYFGLEERKSSYILLSGPLLALSLMMRDQNLIFIPIAIFILLTRLRVNRYLRFLIALGGSLVLGAPLLLTGGLVKTLEIISSVLTPIIIGKPYLIPFTSVGVSPFFLFSTIVLIFSLYLAIPTYFGYVKDRRQIQVFTLFLTLLLFFTTIYPYLWDNYRLGAEFEIVGKGVLSRLISHQIMSETVGVGVELTPEARRIWWLRSFLPLASIPLTVFGFIGTLFLIKEKKYRELSLIIPWILYTSAFTVFFSYLEARFLISTLPALALASSFGYIRVRGLIYRVWRSENWKRRIPVLIDFCTLLSLLLGENILLTELYLPVKPGSLVIVELLRMSLTGVKGWFSNYIAYLSQVMRTPSINLDIVYIIVSLANLLIILFFLICSLRPRGCARPSSTYPGSGPDESWNK